MPVHNWMRCPNCGTADDQDVVCPACGASMRYLLPAEDFRLSRVDKRAPSLGGSELLLRHLRELSIESCEL